MPSVETEIVSPATVVAMFGFVLLCWAFDLRERRIPNWLSGSAMLAGVVANASLAGVPGFIHSILGLGVTIGVLLAPFLLGGIGAGDVKMMGAIGAIVGPSLGMQAVLAGVIFGGLFTLAHLAYVGRLGEKLRATAAMVGDSFRDRALAPLRVDLDAPHAVVMPYSLPLGIGALVVVLFGFKTLGVG